MSWCERLRVPVKGRFRLDEVEPDSTPGARTKQAARARLEKNLSRIDELQYLMYAENRRALLLVFQAMDAGGKDGAIRTLTRGMNPQGCVVTAFKQPSAEELEHDFLWRITRALPRRGEIGIFNRSHYEDVLIVRVHQLVPKSVWSARYDQINRFEENLAENGIHLVKFFLHISKEEQAERFRERLADPKKNWKFSPADLEERKHWDEYQKAFEDALSKCNPKHAPWYVVPSNKQWFRDLAISEIVLETMGAFDMRYPKPDFDPKAIRVD